MTVTLRPLDRIAAVRVALAMREADRREVFALRWPGPEGDDPIAVGTAIAAAARFGCSAWAGGQPAAICGAFEPWPHGFSVFMVATDAWPAVAPAVHRWVLRVLRPGLLAAGARMAFCYSDARHAAAHRWLARLGAQPPHPLPGWGRDGEDFLLFRWSAADVLLQRP